MERVENYRGLEIKIWQDSYNESPFENWDGCIPLMCDGGSHGLKKDYSKGAILDYLLNAISYNQAKRHQRKILGLIGYDLEDFREDFPTEDYDRTTILKEDLLHEWLQDSLENMALFCEEFKIKHYHSISRGYSQSDWSEIFACWTPEFEAETGRTYESMENKDFESGFDLWSNWAWGDVYGFTIEELEDSCGGFYGSDNEESGLMDHAKEAIDYHLERRKRMKFDKLKKYIKNNVPFIYRANLSEIVI